MKKKHAENLLALADKLDTVPVERFDMDFWAEKRSCGTVCCALGWAATLPCAKEVGVSLKATPGNPRDLDIAVKGIPGHSAEKAAKLLFGSDIPFFEFFTCGPDDPKEKATQIREYVATKFKVKATYTLGGPKR